jgi:hypothetical protein
MILERTLYLGDRAVRVELEVELLSPDYSVGYGGGFDVLSASITGIEGLAGELLPCPRDPAWLPNLDLSSLDLCSDLSLDGELL